MKQKLNKLLKNAYGKYSNVKVASIIVDKNNNEYAGVNVENLAYPSGICAERNAIFNAVTNGVKPGEIKEINIISNIIDDFLYPCAGCLQVMSEFCTKDTTIKIFFKDDIRIHLFNELLPFSINKKSFKWK